MDVYFSRNYGLVIYRQTNGISPMTVTIPRCSTFSASLSPRLQIQAGPTSAQPLLGRPRSRLINPGGGLRLLCSGRAPLGCTSTGRSPRSPPVHHKEKHEKNRKGAPIVFSFPSVKLEGKARWTSRVAQIPKYTIPPHYCG